MTNKKREKFNDKNIKINEQELSITKIGEIESANQNPLFIIVIFGIVLIFIFFLPSITTLIKGSGEHPDYSITNPENPKENEKPTEDNNITYYDYSEYLSISLENILNISNFSINQNTLNFTITNNGKSKFDFSKNHYFLEIYTNDKTLLERIMLTKNSINMGASENYSYQLENNTIANLSKLVFIKKDESDYPNITLNKNEAGEEVLECNKDYEKIIYKFEKEKLVSITDAIHISSTISDNYETEKNNWNIKSTLYNSLEGVDSTFIDVGSEFAVSNIIDVKKADISKLNNTYYYKAETLAKVIDFEMKTQGFSCK